LRKESKAVYPTLGVTADSRVNLADDPQRLLGIPSLARLLLRYQDKLFTKLEAAVKGKPYKVLCLYIPYGGARGWGEIQGGVDLAGFEGKTDFTAEMGKLARAHGFGFVDLYPEARAVGPTLFPINSPADHHFLARGHRWMALIAAEKYLSVTEKNP
jgi:hypothetical protein